MKRSSSFVLIALGLAACGGTNSLKTRAAFDLDCPAEQLQIIDLGRSGRGVTGCGRKASYVCKGDAVASACQTWVLNSVDRNEFEKAD